MLLLLLFIAVPLIEIALFVQLGSVLDLGWILLIVVLTAFLGTWLVRQQGRGVLRQLQSQLATMQDPAESLVHGAMILFSGALLLTPGFFTDAIGFLLLVPAIRSAAFAYLRKRIEIASMAAQPQPRARDDIIDGQFEEVRPDPHQNGEPSGWTRH